MIIHVYIASLATFVALVSALACWYEASGFKARLARETLRSPVRAELCIREFHMWISALACVSLGCAFLAVGFWAYIIKIAP